MQLTQVVSVVVIAMAMALGGIGTQGGANPPGGGGGGDDAGCEALFAYRNDVYQVFGEYPEFLDWWASDDSATIDALNPEEADVIVTQGRDFVDGIDALDVPAVYAEGNIGIAGLYGWFNDLIAWVVLEEGGEPDTDDLADALDQIKIGEEAAATTCADAIEDLDGYVLIDPAGIDSEDVPEDPGDVDKNFL